MMNEKQKIHMERAGVILQIVMAIAGPMLAADVSPTAVIRSAEHLADLMNARLVYRLEEAADPAPTPELSLAERCLIELNQKITAIRCVRERTGLGLLEAKNLVDAYRWQAGTNL